MTSSSGVTGIEDRLQARPDVSRSTEYKSASIFVATAEHDDLLLQLLRLFAVREETTGPESIAVTSGEVVAVGAAHVGDVAERRHREGRQVILAPVVRTKSVMTLEEAIEFEAMETTLLGAGFALAKKPARIYLDLALRRFPAPTLVGWPSETNTQWEAAFLCAARLLDEAAWKWLVKKQPFRREVMGLGLWSYARLLVTFDPRVDAWFEKAFPRSKVLAWSLMQPHGKHTNIVQDSALIAALNGSRDVLARAMTIAAKERGVVMGLITRGLQLEIAGLNSAALTLLEGITEVAPATVSKQPEVAKAIKRLEKKGSRRVGRNARFSRSGSGRSR